MAILKFIPPFDGIRGTSGSSTFTAGTSGPYLKRWRMPAHRARPLQTYSRAILSGFAALWRDLADAQRDAWDTYAADPAQEKFNSLGQSYYASGFNWFCQINRQLITAARAQTEDPPTLGVPAAPLFYLPTVYSPEDAGHLSNLNIAFAGMATSDAICFSLLTPGPGILTPKNNFLLLTAEDVDGVTILYIGPYLEALYGAVAVGQRIFFNLHKQNYEGERSPLSPTHADVQAP